MNYCSRCGHKLSRDIPPGDDRLRYICKVCGRVHYQNPKLVVGTISEYGDRILFCRRAIEPCTGLWTLPAGFLENGETVAMGAQRETYEETGAKVKKIIAVIDREGNLQRVPESLIELYGNSSS